MSMKLGLEPSLRVAEFEYDFAKEGGAIGNITLRGGKLPVGALVLNGFVYTETAVTATGAATVALQINSANDVLTATAKGSFTAGAKLQGLPDFATIAESILVASTPKGVVAVVATDALLTGKFRVYVQYIVVA
jgi:hypothetical protein